MHKKFYFVLVCFTFYTCAVATHLKHPTIVISILARNKAHTLPYFLSLLENLNYPKDRIALRIRSDHNIDNTVEILQKWINSIEEKYHIIDTEFVDNERFPDEDGPAHWPKSRFDHLISLRESALNYARKMWADYLLAIDSDVFLTNPDTLLYLIMKNATVIAPMLKSGGLYSNFWHGMTDEYYYARTDDYKPVIHRERLGCFIVPMIHSCVLIDLRKAESDFLTYLSTNIRNYDGPHDDIITFAISANRSDINLVLCNDETFGYVMIPLEQHDGLEYDLMQLTNLKLEVLSEEEPLLVNDLLRPYTRLPTKDLLGFDKIFMINLLRRPERRRRMMLCFDELGLNVTTIDAVDGQALDDTILKHISFLPEYADPYHKRAMTLGEIGCFLSHYNIWKQIVDNHYDTVLVLEDDIRFEPFFRAKVQNLMEEVRGLEQWDLVYFGRKRLQDNEESQIPGTKYLVEAGYSYWTLGYVLNLRGARKLLDADPLSRLLPVDEYLPILFDKHPQITWKGHYPQRNLIALSASPLLLYPTHYTGDKGYISDTEDSLVIKTVSARDDL